MPSGNSMLFADSVHCPSTSIHTLPLIPGPSLTGLWSGMNTALFPQPSANPSATTTKTITIHVSIDRQGATLHSTLEVRDDPERDVGDDPVEHGAFSEYQSSYSEFTWLPPPRW